MLAHRLRTLQSRRVTNVFLLFAALLFLLTGLVGCGNEEEKSSIPEGDTLATVDGSAITSRDYKESLAELQPNQLPVDGHGVPYDMASEAGKTAFVEILINKEVLAQKAIKSGYNKEADVVEARKSHMAGSANQALWKDIIEDPSSSINKDDLLALYEKLGNKRECQYLITNYEKDALAAIKRANNGEDWANLVADYHDGLKNPDGEYTTEVVYGYTDAFFDDAVFSVGIGEITSPIYTGTGYWILKVLGEVEGSKPDLEANTPVLLDIVQRRKVEGLRLAFIEEVRKSHKLTINEETLLIAYNGLDPQELGRDPKTGRAKLANELKPLKVSSKDLDRDFYSYVVEGETVHATLGEYKEHFDKMGGYQRPVYAALLGGMRTKISKQLDKYIITDEARIRGYFDDPEVIREVDNQINKMLTGRLLAQAVSIDEEVPSKEILEYFEAHKSELFIPEKRDGLVVICRDEASALQAIAFAAADQDWGTIIKKMGTKDPSQATGGTFSVVRSDSRPRATALFDLNQETQISKPFAEGDGRYGVVILLKIHEAHDAELGEVNFRIGSIIRNARRDAAMDKLIKSLRAEVEIKIFKDKLAGLPSYEEATYVEQPQNVVSGS